MHLSDDLLSAYLDGELTPSEATAAAAHLGECASCASALRLFGTVDEHVAASPVLSCGAAEAFLSAKVDGELGPEEAAVASTHLSDCAACRADVRRWSVLEQTLAAMPVVAPSRRVDAAIAKLGERGQVRVPRIAGAWPLPTMAVVTAISLILVLSLPQGGSPNVAVTPNAPLVAAAQQTVLNPNTNTLYVLYPDQATVAALDAKTYAQKAVAHVGGRPTALALNLVTNTLLVLDSSTKTVTEIDGASMSVTSATQVNVPGTITSAQVDTKGNLVVSSVVNPTANPSATPGPVSSGTGVISMIDGNSKKLESVIQVDVAPQVIVIEPNGRRALLVSAKQTILADAATYAPLASAVGGVSAAFQIGGDNYAVLSNGAAGAVLTYGRGGASLAIGGTPHAVAPLPGGGFAVLADVAGRGVITLLTPEGLLAATMDAPANGRDLAYDAASRKFAVIGPAGVTDVALPSTLTAGAQSPNPNPAASATPLPTAIATPATSATPAPTQPAVVVAAPPEKDELVPTNARPLWPGTYFVSVTASQRPVRVAGDATRIWYVDPSNRVNVLHTDDGQLLNLGTLPAGASITSLAVTPNHVYFVDAAASAIYVLTISTEQYVRVPLAFASGATAIAGSPDERLWLASANSIVGFDPRTGQVQRVPVGATLTALATDALGRVWTAAGERQAIDMWDPLSGKFTEYAIGHGGSITALAVDRNGAVWIGTDTGQSFAVRNIGTPAIQVAFTVIGRPVTGFALDQGRIPSYVTRTSGSVVFQSVLVGSAAHTAPGTASEPMFDSFGRTWQADLAGQGFYVTLPGGR